MQRVSRLLSPDQPTRLRWVVPVGVLAVVCSGALIAAQLQPVAPVAAQSAVQGVAPVKPARAAHTVRIDRRGTSFHLSESRLTGGDRSYRASINTAGKVIESYTVGGKPALIDADARQWIGRMQSAADTESPPSPPSPPSPLSPLSPPSPPSPPSALAPPALPSPPSPLSGFAPPAPPAPPAAPPPPPLPPLPPALTRTAPYQAAVRNAQQDPGVIARVGSPVVGGEVSEYRHVGNQAAVTFAVSGPRGRTQVHTTATRRGGAWHVTTLDLQGN